MQKMLVSPDNKISDFDLKNLIFAPSFSKADWIIGISGRGVGLDVAERRSKLCGDAFKCLPSKVKFASFFCSFR